MFGRTANEALLDSPAGHALLDRLDAATCDLDPKRDEHIWQVALTVVAARGHA